MKLKITVSLAISLFFIFMFIFTLISCNRLGQTEIKTEESSVNEQEAKGNEATTAKETETIAEKETQVSTGTSEETEIASNEPAADQIKVTNPLPDQVVYSPLLIEGEARGTWFFEASFPVRLMDANGKEIAVYYAQAMDDWMTQDFVPFKSQIEFEKPATDSGILILEKDNPSGLLENDARIEIPVLFDNQSGKIIDNADPQKGEYFVYAILKGTDLKNNIIIVEQLINGPDEKEISPEVMLSAECKAIKVILERPGEKETVSEISLESIKLGSEIGIIFKSDNTARAIIYQEIIEK